MPGPRFFTIKGRIGRGIDAGRKPEKRQNYNGIQIDYNGKLKQNMPACVLDLDSMVGQVDGLLKTGTFKRKLPLITADTDKTAEY